MFIMVEDLLSDGGPVDPEAVHKLTSLLKIPNDGETSNNKKVTVKQGRLQLLNDPWQDLVSTLTTDTRLFIDSKRTS
jgi:hypothetical protein